MQEIDLKQNFDDDDDIGFTPSDDTVLRSRTWHDNYGRRTASMKDVDDD